MSNSFLCEQVGAASCVALWSTSKRTARRSRTQVSCRAVGWLWAQQGPAAAPCGCGKRVGSSRGALLLGQQQGGFLLREGVEEAVSCGAKLRQFLFFLKRKFILCVSEGHMK